jgi:hypothetical protein
VIKRVQLPVPARVGQIHRRHQNFFIGWTGRTGSTGRRPTLRVDNQAASRKRLVAWLFVEST